MGRGPSVITHDNGYLIKKCTFHIPNNEMRIFAQKIFPIKCVHQLYVRSMQRGKKYCLNFLVQLKKGSTFFDTSPLILYKLANQKAWTLWKSKIRPVQICTHFVCTTIFLFLCSSEKDYLKNVQLKGAVSKYQSLLYAFTHASVHRCMLRVTYRLELNRR